MEKILAPMVECVLGKLVYQSAEDVSNKPAEKHLSRLLCPSGTWNSTSLYEVRKIKEFNCQFSISLKTTCQVRLLA